jgi:hypothetical protein
VDDITDNDVEEAPENDVLGEEEDVEDRFEDENSDNDNNSSASS